jgi:hypothetical protein
VQSRRSINIVVDRQGIVNVLDPTLFFKHAENCLLIPRGNAKPLDDQSRHR